MQYLIGIDDGLIAKKAGQSKLTSRCIVILFTVVKHLPIFILQCAVQLLLRSLQLLLQKFGELQRIKINIIVPALAAIAGSCGILDDEVIVQQGGVLMYELEIFIVLTLEIDGLGDLMIQFLVLCQP